MGQSITVDSKQWDAVSVFTTDRSITGQDGAGFESIAAAEASPGFAGTLAFRLFSLDEAIDHVYVASNDVVVKRSADWDETAIGDATRTIEGLFRFYAD